MAGISDFTFDDVEGGITFVVKGDGEVLYRSKLTKKGDRVFNISVNIDGVDSLTLETEYSGEGGRRRAPVAVWINPVVSRR